MTPDTLCHDVNLLLTLCPMSTKQNTTAQIPAFRRVNSPAGLATLGAFFVPEPAGACIVLLAAIWWLCRKVYYGDDLKWLPEVSSRNLNFYIFRATHSATTSVMRPVCLGPSGLDKIQTEATTHRQRNERLDQFRGDVGNAAIVEKIDRRII